jgi:hypothetical protein
MALNVARRLAPAESEVERVIPTFPKSVPLGCQIDALERNISLPLVAFISTRVWLRIDSQIAYLRPPHVAALRLHPPGLLLDEYLGPH